MKTNPSTPIVSCQIRRIRVPARKEWLCSPEFGDHPSSGIKLIYRLEDADGFTGHGEGRAAMGMEELRDPLSRIIGQSPDDLRTGFLDLWQPGQLYWQRPVPPSPYTPPTGNLRHRLRHPLQPALEMALLDLMGRRLGVPVSHFFGGRWQERVKADYWLGRATPELAGRAAKRAMELGFQGIKLKTTLEDPNPA